jgi:hypothetical protein
MIVIIQHGRKFSESHAEIKGAELWLILVCLGAKMDSSLHRAHSITIDEPTGCPRDQEAGYLLSVCATPPPIIFSWLTKLEIVCVHLLNARCPCGRGKAPLS